MLIATASFYKDFIVLVRVVVLEHSSFTDIQPPTDLSPLFCFFELNDEIM